MNSGKSLLGTLLRKDLRLFWQFAILLAGLIALTAFPGLLQQMGPLGPLLRFATSLGTILLILVVFQEDAVASVRHDWLTRPIPGTTQLLAKLLFVLLVIIAPAVLGGIAMGLFNGLSVGESLLAGLAGGTSAGILTLVAVTMCVAAVTGTVRQAIIVTLATFAFSAVLALLLTRLLGQGDPIEFSGSSWVLASGMQGLLLMAVISVLIVQYRHRHTNAGRVIVFGAVLSGFAMVALMSWPRIFAVQKALSPEPAAAEVVRVHLEEACFPARVLDGVDDVPAGRAAEIRANAFVEEQRDRAGADAVAFSTRLHLQGVPDGNRVRVGRVLVRWVAGGKELQRLNPGLSPQKWVIDDAGLPAVDHYWLLRRADYTNLAAQSGVETRIAYSMSLLAPRASAEFLADGSRRYWPGIGYCSATFDRPQAAVSVNCYKWGAQPALLVANLAGAPDIEGRVSGPPDYTPAVIDFWGGQRHNVALASKGPEMPRVTVTAYRARTHFDRQLVVPGVLGGQMSACPAP